jgi:hypothetical protein
MDPFRSEADAFRMLLVVAAGALTVIVIALLFGSLPGFIWGLILFCVGVGRLIRGRRAFAPTSHVAVIVDDVAGDELISELADVEGEPEFVLAMVIPPGRPPAESEMARQRVEISLQRMQEAGLRARGRVLEAEAEELRSGGPVPGVDADSVVVALRQPR